MKFSVKREVLLKPLQLAAGVVERKQTMPILSHLLLSTDGRTLSFVGTDLEVELHGIAKLEQTSKTESKITVPGKKILDICRALPENSVINVAEKNGRVTVSCGKSRFVMTSLPANEFPISPKQKSVMDFSIKQKTLRELIEKTSFAIPQQDVRQYLNGLLFEVKDGTIRTLATDGHRLAIHSIESPVIDTSFAQVIIPRKGVFELLRLLDNADEEVSVSFNNSFVKIEGENFIFISKLISGKFPNYNKIIPKRGDKKVEINCALLKQSLTRVGILSNEMFRSVHFKLDQNSLVLTTNNPDQEEAVEELGVEYQDEPLDTILNIGYLIDILNVAETESINVFFKSGGNGIVIEETNGDPDCLYVLMPIRQ